MPKVEVERSIIIDASPDQVFSVISDLGQWRPWNPWLVTEPEAEVTVREDGKHYRWSGRRTGEGEMQIVGEEAPKSVELDLIFLKPFKSKAKVRFFVEAEGEGSRVRWTMDSSLPFFLFFMKRTMLALLSMDYDRGLGMLKDQLEMGEVPSKIEFTGSSTYPGCRYVGITTECTIDEMPKRMAADFDQLREWRQNAGIETAGDPFSMHLKWDLARGRTKYTCGFPVQELPQQVPSEFVTGTIPALRTHVLTHHGAYRHLGNAWSTGMQMARGKEFRQSRRHLPFETYANFLDDSPDNNREVKLHFPLQ